MRQDRFVELGRLTAEFRVSRAPSGSKPDLSLPEQVRTVVATCGGMSLDDGLYQCHTASDMTRMTALAAGMFPELADRLVCFGMDWLGRQCASDAARHDPSGLPLVLMLEPGTGEALELPFTVVDFYQDGLVDEAEPALARSFYESWRSTSGDRRPLSPWECVGYEIPLFLGGADEVSNLARTDLDVYWTLLGQVRP
jgi:hypothetical protein